MKRCIIDDTISMKIILGNAPIKNGNRGCVALTITIACVIDEIMKKAGLSYELYLPDSQYDDRKIHEILIGDRKIEFKDCRYPIGISLNHVAYIRNDANATGPHIRLSHGANLPFFPGLLQIGRAHV